MLSASMITARPISTSSDLNTVPPHRRPDGVAGGAIVFAFRPEIVLFVDSDRNVCEIGHTQAPPKTVIAC
jgi:hypothetical protein